MTTQPSVEKILSNFAKDIRNGYAKDGRTDAKQALNAHYAEIFLEIVGEAKPTIIAHTTKSIVLNRQQARNHLRAELRAAIKERLGGDIK